MLFDRFEGNKTKLSVSSNEVFDIKKKLPA